MDCPDICRDVFPKGPVSPCRSPDKQSFFITQADSQTIKLQFGFVVHFDTTQLFTDSLVECFHVFLGQPVLQRQHGNFMLDFLKLCKRSPSYPLGWRILTDKLRMRCLEFLQFRKQPVILRIGHDRCILNIIGIVVTLYLCQTSLSA